MTSNQIAYVKQREEQRHNYAMEGETLRSNLAKEAENRRANDLNYNASIYASQASMYNAKLNYDANIYASQMSAAASHYSTDLNYSANTYRTNLEDFQKNQALAETTRHNRAMEQTERTKAGSSKASGLANILNAGISAAKVAFAFMA